ncbi:hypothetical protein E2986_01227 [Frieseomelitta varia]|uniref:protein-synthesizing GTPase n=2 Tax=Meliponini TaxID=83319 RepID=A0A833SBA0_9HYME|nr:hypothetical protein E2986_01227 [Frieseomelitta varia]
MGGEEGLGVTTGQPNLYKQDLSKLDVSKLTALSREVISRQATINIGTIGHVAHGKSTIVKAISGVQTVRFKNELERNITIKLDAHAEDSTRGEQEENRVYKSKMSSTQEKRPASPGLAQPTTKHQKLDQKFNSSRANSYNDSNVHFKQSQEIINNGRDSNYSNNQEIDVENIRLCKGETLTSISLETNAIGINIRKYFRQRGMNNKLEKIIKHDILRMLIIDSRKKQLEYLKEWETEMNLITKGKPIIQVENVVDLESAPQDFYYIEDYLPGNGVIIPDDPPIGCECKTCNSKTNCCFAHDNESCPYTSTCKIRVPPGTPIYECNKRCSCDINCFNRVVQRGSEMKFCIFRTANGRGWGVKTLKPIKKGCFVTQYVGEVITNEEAEKRGKEYDAAGRTYLFDLDYNEIEGECPYTVDAAVYGNISHFINHSCDPNLAVYGVWIDCLDPNLPKLALFATRDIKQNEEITFDYMCQSSKNNENSIKQNMSMKDNFNIYMNIKFQEKLKLRYANAKIYKCDNEKCPRPGCYISGGSSKDDSFPCIRPICSGRFQLVRHVSFVDCPGHDILMATMLNGAAVMDAALLLIAGNESCPQPQTSEHLAAIEIMKLKHIVILQNKIDLVKEAQAKEQYEQILKFVQGTVAEGAPVIPISAQLKYNIEVLCEYITKKIPVPLRDFTSEPRLIVIRSFDVNKPGCEVDDLKGGVAGGSILRGVLKVGMEIEVRPGLVSKDSEGKLTCRPIFSRIVSLFAEQNELQFAVPGGLIGVGTKIEPTLCRADRLVGQILGAVGALPKIFIELEISYYLLKRLLGVRTEGDKKGARVPKLSKNEVLLVNIGSLSTGGRVLATRADLAKISLTNPVCTEIDEKIALSRRVEKHWRLIGWGQICGGQTIEPVIDRK